MAVSCHAASTAKQLTTQLSAAFNVLPKQTWIDGFLSTQKLTTPFPSLLATAKVRFLNADVGSAFSIPARASSATPTATATAANVTAKTLPHDIHDAELAERRLAGPIALQVLDVQDISRSRWSQLEDIEAAERGETTKGREIIRVVPTERHTDGGGSDVASEGGVAAGAGSKSSSGICKLLLQDAHGTQVWAVELRKVKGVRIGMNIGTKVDLHT